MAVSAAAGRDATSKQSVSFIIGASSVGTLIEWYDFLPLRRAGRCSSASTSSRRSMDPTVAFIASLFVFWTGFLVRPFGAIVFGHLGDLIGRKFTFMLTLLLMGASTFVVGLLPGYEAIGALAPILLVAMRVLQGLALGGEYGGAATYIAEHAPDEKRGYFTSLDPDHGDHGHRAGAAGDPDLPARPRRPGVRRLGLARAVPDLGGPGAAVDLHPPEARGIAALRGAQAAGQVLGQSRARELQQRQELGPDPARALRRDRSEGVVWYTGQFYALFYMTAVLKINYVTVYIIFMIALTVAAPFFIVFGALSDKVGRRNIMTLGFALAVISYWPVFTWFGTFKDNPVVLTILVFYLVILVTMVYGPIAAFLVELFPARIRYTSMSLPYHVGNGVFGGLVPAAGASVAAITGVALGGLLYPMAIAGVGVIVGLAFMREPTHHVKIWEEVGGPPLVPDQP